MNKTSAVLIGLAAVVLGAFGGYLSHFAYAPQTGGDFAGGVVPSQLFTANTATNSVSPILSNLFVPGAVSVGGSAANNQVTAMYTVTGFYPTAAVALLGPIGSATSTTSTALSFTASGFSVGDSCNIYSNANTSTIPLDLAGNITAVSGNNVTATILFANENNAIATVNNTSSATGVTSTLKATCFHTGV